LGAIFHRGAQRSRGHGFKVNDFSAGFAGMSNALSSQQRERLKGGVKMKTETQIPQTERFGRCVAISKRVRWDIDKDVIRGRSFDLAHKFLPDGLSQIGQIDFLSATEKRYLSQIQGRTYANVFGLVERFINAKVLELSRDHSLGDQVALEGLVRFCDEELKHQ
jgi:hypothetical protein